MPLGQGTIAAEPFQAYLGRWPTCYTNVPEPVIESWIYRHWYQFQQWLPLHPLMWAYELTTMTNEEIMAISHVKDWPKVLKYWGDDLLDGPSRKNSWLGRYMLENGTTPAPIIVARDAAAWTHPRERVKMIAPNQLVEGHMRLAYLQAMIRRQHENLRDSHAVVVAQLPP